MKINQEIIDWLMDGDPVIQYQTARDLTGCDQNATDQYRKQISQKGWGPQLLSKQDPEGTWAKKLYSPKWTSTTYTMLLLSRFQMETNPQITKGCDILINQGFYDKDNGINFWASWTHRSETCVTGMVLSILATFGYRDERVAKLANYLFDQQMPDGGWNCLSYRGHTHSSFHTTISVLEGLRLYEKYLLPLEPHPEHEERIKESRQKAMDFLLLHHLYRSHRTGEIVSEPMTRFSFPPRWHYDVLRALDFAQDVNAGRHEGFNDAIALLEKKQTKEGLWKLQNKHPGKTYFQMEKTGQPSRWNTLRALRVLKWWNK
ncbi:MAG: hypothetical protein GY757_27135 [bacterium]|nr:hypothetical protein [bacterium]